MVLMTSFLGGAGGADGEVLPFLEEYEIGGMFVRTGLDLRGETVVRETSRGRERSRVRF